MATKKSIKSKSIPERVEELQAAASKQVKDTLEFLAEEPRKIVANLRADLDKRGKKIGKDAEKAVRGLRSDIEKRTKDLSKRAEKAVDETRKRAESFATDVRKQVEKAVEPVATRLDVASRADVDRLRKRLDQIEKRIGQLAPPAAPNKPASEASLH